MTNPVAPPPPADGSVPPPPPAGFGAAPQAQEGFGAAPQQPSKAKSIAGGLLKRIIGAVIAFAVIGGIGYAWRIFSGDPTTANVGDCLIEASADDMKIVKCDDPTAAHKVVGKEKMQESAFNASQNPCTAYSSAEQALWSGKRGRSGDVLCLEPLKK